MDLDGEFSISPLRRAVLLLLAIFACEYAVMLVLGYSPIRKGLVEDFADAAGLTIILLPPIYFTVIKPATKSYSALTVTHMHLREANNTLEVRVDERTSELLAAKQSLEKIVEQLTVYQEELHRTIVDLRAANDTLEGLRNMSSEAIVSFDDKLKVISFSHAAEKIFGWEKNEIIGRNIRALMPRRSRVKKDVVQQYLNARKGTQVEMFENRAVIGLRSTGEEFSGVLSVRRVENETDSKYVAILRDVTEEKKLTTDLIAAKEKAESANEAKSSFIANMSHELRTPLNAIMGFSSMMSEEILGPIGLTRYREYASDINQSGKHLLGLINTILDLTRLDAGKAQLNEEVCNIEEMATGCLKWISGMAREENILLHSSFPEHVVNVMVDRRMLKQVLLNLLSNALKFTRNGGQVSLTVTAQESEGVSIVVQDTGIGMSQSDIERVGEPFVQIDTKLSRKYEGTGLGLAITKRIIELHGGQLYIRSELGIGTLVTVTLPPSRICLEATDNDAQRGTTFARRNVMHRPQKIA